MNFPKLEDIMTDFKFTDQQLQEIREAMDRTMSEFLHSLITSEPDTQETKEKQDGENH